jgi:hypothetical protein
VTLGAAKGFDSDVLARIAARPLRNAHALAVAGIGPAVIGADNVAGIEPALAEPGGAMAAAVDQRRGLAGGIAEQHEVGAEQGEGRGPPASRSLGMTGYQKRRRTFCCVTSIAASMTSSCRD